MAMCALVHASDGLTRNRGEPETRRSEYDVFIEKKPGLGDTIDGISCDGDDNTVHCSHCHTFSLSVYNLLAVQKHFDLGGGMSSRLITETEWLYYTWAITCSCGCNFILA